MSRDLKSIGLAGGLISMSWPWIELIELTEYNIVSIWGTAKTSHSISLI